MASVRGITSALRPISVATVVVAASSMAAAQMTAPVHEMLPHFSANGIAHGDFDGDGALDLITASQVVFGDGHGRFLPHQRLHFEEGIYFSPYREIGVADVDLDGDLDALVSLQGESCYSVEDTLLLNDGAGNLTRAPLELPAAGWVTSLEFADIDGDADPDLLLGYDADETPSVCSPHDRLLVNDGAGHFTDATAQWPHPDSRTSCLATGDVDGDGDLDVWFGSTYFPPRMSVNDGAGHFSDASAHIPAQTGFHGMAPGDFDGDGDLDLALAGSSGARLWINDGSGTFVDASAGLPASSDVLRVVKAADLDRDSDLDLLVWGYRADYSGDVTRVWTNQGGGVFSDESASFLDGPETSAFGVDLADFDGDGDWDAVTGETLWLGDSLGHLHLTPAGFPVPPMAQQPGFMGRTALADLDFDGDLDLVYDEYFDHRTQVRLNERGTFELPPVAFPTNSDQTNDFAVGDVDGDGDADILVALVSSLWSSGSVRLYRSTGGATFAPATQLATTNAQAYSLALGDVDGDQDLDLLVGIGDQGTSRLFENDGSGLFSDASSRLPQPAIPALDVAMVDVDLDLDLDLFLVWPGQRALYSNDGSGHFSDASSQVPVVLAWVYSLAFGDLEPDGDPDLVISGAYGTTNMALLRNDGAGHFVDASSEIAAQYVNQARKLRLVDADDDGRVDIVAGDYGVTNVLRRAGNQYVLAEGFNRPDAGCTEAADLDADGDVDLLDFDARVHFNRTRHVAWRDVPRIGATFHVDVSGPPLSRFVLAASRDTAHVPFGQLGVLGIARDAIVELHHGTLDEHGHASIRVHVPSDPALVGEDFYWQAVVGSPARLTNVETALITDW